MADKKTQVSMGFSFGGLNIRLSGYMENGSGEIWFKEKNLDMDEEGYYVGQINRSEMVELRNYLNKRLAEVEEQEEKDA